MERLFNERMYMGTIIKFRKYKRLYRALYEPIDNNNYIKEEEVKKENESLDNKNNKIKEEKAKINKKRFIKQKRKLSEEENKEDDKENNLIIKEKENNKKIIEIDESCKNIIGIRMEYNELIAVIEIKVNNKNKEEIISNKKLKEINP